MKLTQFTQNRCAKHSTTTLNVTICVTYQGINFALQYYVSVSRVVKRSNFTWQYKVYLPNKERFVSH
jgi:hypothetical protein